MVLESTERRLEEFPGVLVRTLRVAFVDAGDPPHDAFALGSVEPLEQAVELLLSEVASTSRNRASLDLFIDERKQEWIVSIEKRDQSWECERVLARGGSRGWIRQRQECLEERLKTRGEARGHDVIQCREKRLAVRRQGCRVLSTRRKIAF